MTTRTLEHNDLPRLALSVRQPWAWAIINAGKDIENRAWRSPNPGLSFRGRVAIHAASGMTRDEYAEAREWIDTRCYTIPTPDPSALFLGGIIGTVDVVDVISASDSWWWIGPRGLVLANAAPCHFIPARGARGYFQWTRDDTYRANFDRPKWHTPQPRGLTETTRRLMPEPDLFKGDAS